MPMHTFLNELDPELAHNGPEFRRQVIKTINQIVRHVNGMDERLMRLEDKAAVNWPEMTCIAKFKADSPIHVHVSGMAADCKTSIDIGQSDKDVLNEREEGNDLNPAERKS